MNAAVVGAASFATLFAALRWLRVAQREHYLAGSVTRFASRWWRIPVNLLIGAATIGAAVASWWWPAAGFGAAIGVGVSPIGLAHQGRTRTLGWTRRRRTRAAVWLVLHAAAVVAGVIAGSGPQAAVAVALAAPVILDVACALTTPFERRAAQRFVAAATARLREVGPAVIAITGSYGKTSTKTYVAHLVGGARPVLASPASFNNTAGLSRAINEHLTPETEVFIAEMGAYGPGEIAALCSWVRPSVGVITAIGPVHLERFGSEDRIVEAKSEIVEHAPVAVLNVDDPRLRALADRLAAAGDGRRILRCSAVDRAADVCVEVTDGGALSVHVGGQHVADVAGAAAAPGNVACAIAAALAVDVPLDTIRRGLPNLPTPANRQSVGTLSTGATVIDDTYNANPTGAASALATLERLAAGRSGRRVVITPGMVELGPRQAEENSAFAAAAARVATDLFVVGRTNRRALLAGAAEAGGSAEVRSVSTRQVAVEWVKANTGPDDVVLYENDLPDHFP